MRTKSGNMSYTRWLGYLKLYGKEAYQKLSDAISSEHNRGFKYGNVTYPRYVSKFRIDIFTDGTFYQDLDFARGTICTYIVDGSDNHVLCSCIICPELLGVRLKGIENYERIE